VQVKTQRLLQSGSSGCSQNSVEAPPGVRGHCQLATTGPIAAKRSCDNLSCIDGGRSMRGGGDAHIRVHLRQLRAPLRKAGARRRPALRGNLPLVRGLELAPSALALRQRGPRLAQQRGLQHRQLKGLARAVRPQHIAAHKVPPDMGHPLPDHVKVKRLHPQARLPRRASHGASGFDLHACLPDGPLRLSTSPVLVPTGLAIEAPAGVDAQVRPRSGLSLRGVTATFGTIDSDYRGEVMVTLYLLPGTAEYAVQHGDRIAQLVFGRLAQVELREVDDLEETGRGEDGHGSTGR